MNTLSVFSRVSVLALFSISFFISAPLFAESSEWTIMPNEKFQQLLEDLDANPTLFDDNRNLITQLSGDQFAEMINYLGLTHFTYLHPVIMKANELMSLNGKAIAGLSVMSVRGGNLIPIPFQIDELDVKGWVHTGEDAIYDMKGKEGILDEDDELVFMLRDTGRAEYNPELMNPVDGKVLKELTFDNGDGTSRYAYIVEGSELRSTADYVDFDMHTGIASTTFYNFKTKPTNFLVFEDFKARVGDNQSQRVLDAILVDVSTNVFTKWSPRVSLNNFDNLEATPFASKDGPVRSATLIKLWVVIAKVPVFRIVAQLDIWDQGLGLPVKINIPGAEILTRMLVDPYINIALDFTDITGGHVSAALNPDPTKYGVVDGKMSDFEKALNITLEHNWLWVESGHGWDVFFDLQVPLDLDVGVRLFYEDDPNSFYANESFPGALPRAGWTVDRLPKDKLNIDLRANFWFPDSVGPGGPLAFKSAKAAAPIAQVSTFSAEQIASVE